MSTKSRVLSSLENNKGSFISGAGLAEECHVSRNAIWKIVNELKSEGYRIESVNNRGYMLHEDSDIISEEGIRLYLKFNKKIKDVSKYPEIIVLDEIDSTNSEAKRILITKDDAIIHGTTIVAIHQTSGRGHNGRGFDSPDGGIYMSIILEPAKLKYDEPITVYIAEKVRNVLQGFFEMTFSIGDKGRIYQDRKKVCGILTEGFCDMETGEYSNYVVGIGIRYEDIKYNVSKSKNQLIAEIVSGLI